MLDYIMRRIQVRADLGDLPKPCDYFDIIAGTSTGGLIAIMLGRLRMTTTEALQTYDDVAGNIFSNSNRRGKGLKFPKFKEGPLVQIVQDMVRDFSDTDTMVRPAMSPAMSPTMRNRKGKAFVCAVEPDKLGSAQRFRTYTVEDEADQWLKDCKIWEAARATTAATMFFKEITITYNTISKRFIDGALGYNNPVEELIDEAGHILSRKRKVGAIVSLGTGTKPKGLRSTEDVGFLALPYGFSAGKTLKDIAVDPEAAHRRVRDKLKAYPDTYFRFNVPGGAVEIGLEDWQKMGVLKERTKAYLAQEEVEKEMEALVEVLLKNKQPTDITIGHLTLNKRDIPNNSRTARYLTSPSSRFVGRRGILNRLDDHFMPRSEHYKPRREFLLCGMGGAGKTQIALKFAENCEKEERFKYIFFVDAENIATARQSYATIASQQMGQPVGQDDSMENVMRRIASLADDWLLVADNSTSDTLRKIVPEVNRGNILYTSRNHNLGLDLPPEAIAFIDDMTVDDAITLLLRASQLDPILVANREEAFPLVEELGCLALAVDQAGAYIHVQHLKLSQYLERFQERRAEILRDERYKGADARSRAVYATFDLSYQAIRDLADDNKDNDEGLVAVDALTILDIICFYHNENIPVPIFAGAAIMACFWKEANRGSHPVIDGRICFSRLLSVDESTNWNPEPTGAAISLLEDFSLIKVDYAGMVMSMHILVSSWAMDRMDVRRRMERACLAKTLFCWAIPEELGRDMNLDSHLLRRQLYTHATTLESYLGANRKMYTKYRHWDDAAESYLDLKLGFLFRESGEYQPSETAYERALFLRKLEYGFDHPETLDVYTELIELHQRHKRYREAEFLLLQQLERAERPVSVEVRARRSGTGRIKARLVRKRLSIGKGKEPERSTSSDDGGCTGALPGNPAVDLNPASPSAPNEGIQYQFDDDERESRICMLLFMLVGIYGDQGNTQSEDATRHKAIRRIEQYLRRHDENDPEVAGTRKMLHILRSEAEEPQAKPTEELHAQIAALRTQLDNHLAQGRHPSDMEVIKLKRSLAQALDEVGQHAEALPLHEAYIEGCAYNYGLDDRRSLQTLRRYGQSRWDDSGPDRYLPEERHFRTLLGRIIRAWGKQEPEAGSTLLELGRSIAMQGRFDEGITLLEKAVELHRANRTFETERAERILEDIRRMAEEGTPALRRGLARAAIRRWTAGNERWSTQMVDFYTLQRGWNWQEDGRSRPECVYLTEAELKGTATRFPNLVGPLTRERALAQPIELLHSAGSDNGGEGPSSLGANEFM